MPPTDATKTGWPLLHSKLPPQALKALDKSVYGVGGLTDVNEGFLIQRLFASEFPWEWRLVAQQYLGFEDRTIRGRDGKPDYEMRYYLASVQGVLVIDGREFHGAGASDNRKIDAAFKGAATVAFKNACKLAGLTIELFKDGKAMDFIYEDRHGNAIQGAGSAPLDEANPGVPTPAPTDTITPTVDPKAHAYLLTLGASLSPEVNATTLNGLLQRHSVTTLVERLENKHREQHGAECVHTHKRD